MVAVKGIRRRTGKASSSAQNSPLNHGSSSNRIDPSRIDHNQIPIIGNHSFDFNDSVYSPYSLSNSDNPGNAIIGEILDGTNYMSWKIAMSVALDAKNKIAFVDETLPRPPKSHASFRIWSRCNSMVKSWLMTSVNKQIYKSILCYDDASEIWRNLMVRFHITNLPRSYALTREIWSLQQGSMSLSEYYTQLKILWDELDGAESTVTCHNCSCCKAMSTTTDHSKIIKFLAGLNESYAAVRSNIIMKKPVPELAEIYNLLDQDFSQRNIGSSTNAAAFNVNVGDQVSINATAHHYNNNPKQNRVICSHCGYTGHSIDKCYRIHGYPPRFKHNKVTNNQEKPNTQSKPVVANLSWMDKGKQVEDDKAKDGNISEIVKGLSNDQIQEVIAYFSTQLHTGPHLSFDRASTSHEQEVAPSGISHSYSTLCLLNLLADNRYPLNSQTWIVDSGATHHVCHDLSSFKDISYNLQSTVTLPTGMSIKVAGVGNIQLTEEILIEDVLYIPDFRLNLLSVSDRPRMASQVSPSND